MSRPPIAAPTPDQQNAAAKKLAAQHGFPLSGIALVPPDGRTHRADSLRHWVAQGLHGPLDYMRRTLDARAQIRSRFPWAKSLLMLGAFHARKTQRLSAHVARYAYSHDYHLVFEKRLKKLTKALIQTGVCAQAHWYTDTGPVLERAWAEVAGLGWIGKNACLIHPRGGSYLLLAEIIMDSAPAPDRPERNHCGTCTRCLKACPTQAFVSPGILDARRCLSTWTIEARGQTPQEFWTAQGKWVFGCDICQEVCPFNAPERTQPSAPDEELSAVVRWHELTLPELITLSDAEFKNLFTATPLRRCGLTGLRLNAITAAGNTERDDAVRAALERSRTDPDPDIRARARYLSRDCKGAGWTAC